MNVALLLLVVLGPLIGAGLAMVGRDVRAAGRPVVIGSGVAAAAALGLIVSTGTAAVGRVGWPTDGGDWLGLGVSRPGAVLVLLVAGTTAVIAAFSQRSLDHDGRAPRYMALVGLVSTGSTLVVLQGHPALMVVGWLVSGWALVGLIGFIPGWPVAVAARSRIWRTLAVGDVALVAAALLAGWASDGLLSGQPGPAVDALRDTSIAGVAVLHVVAILVVVAGASRSALLPFHRWLIGTLAAPTPVSALVHAGLVSGAGLILLRFADVFVQSGPAVVLAFALGIATVLVASSAMIMRSDAKGALAWSTVAQMAFMVIQCSVGAFSSAVFHIGGHGMYKAALFLGVGDTAATGLRARRRASGHQPLPAPARLAVSILVPAAAVAAAVLVIPPVVSDAGRVLIVVFAWLSLAFALSGWLAKGPMAPATAAVTGSVGAVVLAFVYVGGLRLFEGFVEPSLGSIPSDTAIGAVEVIVAIALVATVAALAVMPGRLGRSVRQSWRRLVVASVEPGAPPSSAAVTGLQVHPIAAAAAARAGAKDLLRLAEIRADGAKAAAIIAPQWPLASFVAVNPLDGVESLGFDRATAEARRWLGARTHLTLEQFRADHRDGRSKLTDLEHVVRIRFADLCAGDPIEIDGRAVSPVEIILADLLHAPDAPGQVPTGTALAARGPLAEPWSALIDDLVTRWLAAYVEPPVWGGPKAGERFAAMCCRHLVDDPRLSALLDPSTRAALAELGGDPANIADLALEVVGVPADQRVDELRAQLCRLSGWAGLAKWRNQWAHPDERIAPLAPLDLAAVRTLLEAVVLGSGVLGPVADLAPSLAENLSGGNGPSASDPTDGLSAGDPQLLDRRVGAVADALAPGNASVDRQAIAGVLAQVPIETRPSLWLSAQERRFEHEMLSLVDRGNPTTTIDRPEAQAVFCIDVRSEGFRRHLEAEATVQTVGFAGFFGVPMRLRLLGWDHSEARCPVLVAPAITATEHPRHDAIGQLSAAMTRQRIRNGVDGAHARAKYGLGAGFTLAETVGWATGPQAAARTLLPRQSSAPDIPPTSLRLDDDEILLEQRVFFAEGALRTMGLASNFAPLVLLCGHTSQTTNNPHATALECGACAGASGGDNARAVVALLNAPDVRHGLVDRGIELPDDTWFLAGLHDTASDRVALLDVDEAPATHRERIAELERALAAAGQLQSQDRANDLPGPPATVRDRGADWAQVRPEWGLAGNAAFIIGPRSMTAGLDLGGRAFLHEYDDAADPTGRVLETIMTAPLVVGHWISAQYYFSTVDPERFGAGDKLVHNPIGTTGVVSGDRGDLRVGLPLQSTHVDGRRHHQPLRLMAVIQADLGRIDEVIAANPVLQSLTGGSWLRIAARSDHGEPWSLRAPDGAWMAHDRSLDQPLDQPSSITPNKELT